MSNLNSFAVRLALSAMVGILFKLCLGVLVVRYGYGLLSIRSFQVKIGAEDAKHHLFDRVEIGRLSEETIHAGLSGLVLLVLVVVSSQCVDLGLCLSGTALALKISEVDFLVQLGAVNNLANSYGCLVAAHDWHVNVHKYESVRTAFQALSKLFDGLLPMNCLVGS